MSTQRVGGVVAGWFASFPAICGIKQRVYGSIDMRRIRRSGKMTALEGIRGLANYGGGGN